MTMHDNIKLIKLLLSDNQITYSQLSEKTNISESKLQKIFAGCQDATLKEFDLIQQETLKIIHDRQMLKNSD